MGDERFIATEQAGKLGNYLFDDPPDEDKFSVCVHCGMCLEACPTYQETGLEQHSPRGRVHLIKSVAEGKMELNEAFADPVFQCLDCRACETACPANVQVGTLIEQARGQVRQAMPLSGWKGFVSRFFLRGIFPYPERLHLLGRLLKFYQKSGLQSLARKTGLLRIGIYNITHPEMASRLLERKIDDIPDEVELVTMGNPGCMLQIAMGVHKHHRKEKVVHTVQVLDWAYQQEKEQGEKETAESAGAYEHYVAAAREGS